MILVLATTAGELLELEAAHRRSLRASLGSPSDQARSAPEPGDGNEARRSLSARGLLTPDGGLAEDDDLALAVRTALDVRASSSLTLGVERLAATPEPGAATHGVRLVHLLDDVACVEDVLDHGTRYLWLVLEPSDVAGAVLEFVVPDDAAPGTGPVRRTPTDRPDLLGQLLGHPTVLAQLSRVDGLGEVTSGHLVALGPGGCWVADSLLGRPVGAHLEFRPVAPAWVGGWVRAARVPQGPAPPGREGTMAG